jgi:hypothetical protein
MGSVASQVSPAEAPASGTRRAYRVLGGDHRVNREPLGLLIGPNFGFLFAGQFEGPRGDVRPKLARALDGLLPSPEITDAHTVQRYT